jgi:hypothetical protein
MWLFGRIDIVMQINGTNRNACGDQSTNGSADNS